MKTLLILILAVALVGGAALSRPSEESFRTFYEAQKTASADNVVDRAIKAGKADWDLNNLHYQSRFLWADVQKDGKTVYSGVFSHWFKR